jgi:hypothetical protein
MLLAHITEVEAPYFEIAFMLGVVFMTYLALLWGWDRKSK